jgi:hypothetical protein
LSNNIGAFWPIGSAACSAGKQRAADDHDAANVILLSLLTLAAEHFLLEHVSGIVRIQ